MELKVDLTRFLDEKGNVLLLTEQANIVFNFLIKIVTSVSQNIKQPLIYVDLKCSSRGFELACTGDIEASCSSMNTIDWYCDTCEAAGTISNWQGSLWDLQARTIH